MGKKMAKKQTPVQKVNSLISRSLKKIYKELKEISPDNYYINMNILTGSKDTATIMWNVDPGSPFYSPDIFEEGKIVGYEEITDE